MTARARPGRPGVARHGSEETGAGGGRARDTVCLSRTTSVSDSTRRKSGQERPQPGIGGRSRHDASRSTSSASQGVTCDLLSLSLSERLCLSCLSLSLSLSLARPTSRILCAPVCVSVVCAAPACLSGCAFQAQCAGSSWRGAVSDIDQQEAAIPTWTAFSSVPSRHLSWLACLPRWPATVVDRGRRRSRGGRVRGYAGLGGVCHAGGGERGDRASEEEGVPASDTTRRKSGQERPQPGIGGRSRHDASRNTSSASREVTCDLLCLSLSVSLSVCLSPALRLPACLGVISKCSGWQLVGCGLGVVRQEVALPQGGAPCCARNWC